MVDFELIGHGGSRGAIWDIQFADIGVTAAEVPLPTVLAGTATVQTLDAGGDFDWLMDPMPLTLLRKVTSRTVATLKSDGLRALAANNNERNTAFLYDPELVPEITNVSCIFRNDVDGTTTCVSGGLIYGNLVMITGTQFAIKSEQTDVAAEMVVLRRAALADVAQTPGVQPEPVYLGMVSQLPEVRIGSGSVRLSQLSQQ